MSTGWETGLLVNKWVTLGGDEPLLRRVNPELISSVLFVIFFPPRQGSLCSVAVLELAGLELRSDPPASQSVLT